MTTDRIAIQTKTEFHEALRNAFDEMARIGCPEIRLCDVDFADWPLGTRDVIARLDAWVASRRRLVLLASGFDEVARRHARFVEWRRPWSHVVECHANTEDELPAILVAPGLLCIELHDRTRYRGVASRDPADTLHCKELIDAVLQRSVTTFPVTTAGL